MGRKNRSRSKRRWMHKSRNWKQPKATSQEILGAELARALIALVRQA